MGAALDTLSAASPLLDHRGFGELLENQLYPELIASRTRRSELDEIVAAREAAGTHSVRDFAQSPFLWDCTLVAVLSAVAEARPGFLDRLVTRRGDGSWSVRLYEPERVLVALEPPDGLEPIVEGTTPEGGLTISYWDAAQSERVQRRLSPSSVGRPWSAAASADGRTLDLTLFAKETLREREVSVRHRGPPLLMPLLRARGSQIASIVEQAVIIAGGGMKARMIETGVPPSWDLLRLTGVPGLEFTPEGLDPARLFEALVVAKRSGDAIVACTKRGGPMDIFKTKLNDRHAYVVRGVFLKNGVRTVSLYNTWGGPRGSRFGTFEMPFDLFMDRVAVLNVASLPNR